MWDAIGGNIGRSKKTQRKKIVTSLTLEQEQQEANAKQNSDIKGVFTSGNTTKPKDVI